jgi:hypothetical protein
MPHDSNDNLDREIARLADDLEQQQESAILPDNFYCSEEDGSIWYRGEKAPYFVCSALAIAANTCDPDNESWGRRLCFPDAQGKRRP